MPAARTDDGSRALAAVARGSTWPKGVHVRHRGRLLRIAQLLQAGRRDIALDHWRRFLAAYVTPKTRDSVEALALYVLHAAYLAPKPELREHANRLRALADKEAALDYRADYLRGRRRLALKGKKVKVKDAGGKRSRRLTQAEIDSLISSVEADREIVRNRRGMTNSQFEKANQKATQYTNMLASVLKTMNEMSAGIIRNLR
jgi:hypothetical protein